MLPTFQAVNLASFLTLDEPIFPRFVTEFYHSLEVKRDEEERPYIEFKLGQFNIKFIFHERVINPLDILWNPIKEKGKRVAPPSSSSLSSSSDENEVPPFLEFYEELYDNEDLTDAQKEKKGMFKCLNRYFESSNEEHQNEKPPSPPPTKKTLSPPHDPSKSTSSRSTHYTSSSSPSESPKPTHVAPPPKL
ncbi:hypothetical protein Tco_0335866 [Tanacetum coccineum]